MGRKPSPCGTEAAYKRHLRKGEPTCEVCREAHRELQASKRSVPKLSIVPPPVVDVPGADEVGDLELIRDTLRKAMLTTAETDPSKVAPIARELRATLALMDDDQGASKEKSLAEQLAEARAAREARTSG